MMARSEAIHWNGASFGLIKVKILLRRKSFAYYFKNLSTNYLLLVLEGRSVCALLVTLKLALEIVLPT